MQRFLWICFSLISLAACSSTKSDHSATKTASTSNSDPAVALTSLLTTILEINDTCTIDARTGIGSAPSCSEYLKIMTHYGQTLNPYIKARIEELLKNETNPERIAKITTHGVRDAVAEVSDRAIAKLPEPVDQSKVRLIETLADSLFEDVTKIKPASWFHVFSMGGLYSKDHLSKLLMTLSYSATEVRYDGVNSTLEFSNEGLKRKISYLAMALVYAPQMFQEAYLALPPERQKFWTEDENAVGGASRVEPYDLLVVGVKHILQFRQQNAIEYDFNPIQLGQLAAKSIDHLLHISRNPEIPSIQLIRKSNNPLEVNEVLALCSAAEGFAIVTNGREEPPSEYVDLLVGASSLKKESFDKNTVIHCAGKQYHLRRQFQGGDTKLQRPSFTASSTESKSVFTTALVNEVNSSAVAAAIAYLTSNGYYIQPHLSYSGIGLWEEIDDLKADYIKEASDADLLIPVSHSSSLAGVNLGAKKSIKITASKNVRTIDGQTRLSLLLFYLPSMTSTSGDKELSSLSDHDIAALLHARRAAGRKSLGVLSTSCFSEKTISLWMRAYGMTVESEDRTDLGANDAPFIIAAKRGFATDSTLHILSHFDFPLGVIDRHAEGKGVDDIMSFLKAPPASSQRRSLEFANKFFELGKTYEEMYKNVVDKAFWSKPDESFRAGFDPITNVEINYYWDGSKRVDLILENTANPADTILF